MNSGCLFQGSSRTLAAQRFFVMPRPMPNTRTRLFRLRESITRILVFIDLYDRGDDSRLDEIADAIEKELDGLNCPSDGILPTFFLESRYPVEEKDKELYHTQMHLQVHLYDNKEVKNA